MPGPAKAKAKTEPTVDAAAAAAAADAADDDAGAAAEEPVVPEVELPDAPIIARRDALLTPISSKLSRTIKRHLGDDQNRLLDRLRSAPTLEADELMGSEDEHLAAFAAAARNHLDEAFAAGTVFVGAGAATIPAG